MQILSWRWHYRRGHWVIKKGHLWGIWFNLICTCKTYYLTRGQAKIVRIYPLETITICSKFFVRFVQCLLRFVTLDGLKRHLCCLPQEQQQKLPLFPNVNLFGLCFMFTHLVSCAFFHCRTANVFLDHRTFPLVLWQRHWQMEQRRLLSMCKSALYNV